MQTLSGISFLFRNLDKLWVRKICFHVLVATFVATLLSFTILVLLDYLPRSFQSIGIFAALIPFGFLVLGLGQFGKRVFMVRLPVPGNSVKYLKVYGFGFTDKGYDVYLLTSDADRDAVVRDNNRSPTEPIDGITLREYVEMYPCPIGDIAGVAVTRILSSNKGSWVDFADNATKAAGIVKDLLDPLFFFKKISEKVWSVVDKVLPRF